MASKRPVRSRTPRPVTRASSAALRRQTNRQQQHTSPGRLKRAIASVQRVVQRVAARATRGTSPSTALRTRGKGPEATERVAAQARAEAARRLATVAPPSHPSVHLSTSSAPTPPAQHHTAPSSTTDRSFEPPAGYGETKIVLLVRDPWWLFSYWEVTPQAEAAVRATIPVEERDSIVSMVRVYDVTDGEANAPSFDIVLRDLANNWYIHVGKPDRAWIVEIGLRTSRGHFFRFVRSNRVTTPRYGPSDVIDEEWMSLEEEYWKLFGVAGGFGIGKSSMEIRQRFREQLRAALFSGAVSSFGASPVKQQRVKERGFWCWVDTELIVYGATEPDATVTIQGQSVTLRPDGTFSARMALPDGQQVIPVQATSADQAEMRTITPIVTRETERAHTTNHEPTIAQPTLTSPAA